MGSQQRVAAKVVDLVFSFLARETTGAAVLLAAAAVAVAWANSPFASSYEALWHTTLELRLGGATVISRDLQHWVNDALMALFFFVVGLEIKREIVEGDLSTRQRAALPAAAALGGMVVPAAIYVALNAGGDAVRGWGIPMATDIAFALGALALFGRRVPHALTVFLLALAIADDIGAIIVIAVFYTPKVELVALGIALAALVGVLFLWRLPQHWSDPPLVLLMVVVWAATLASGIHATIAGVALGLLAPVDRRPGKLAVAERLELTLHPWTTYVIVPLFALANAGVPIQIGSLGDALVAPTTLGIVAGLVIGKPLGIVAACWIATRFGLAALPRGVRWPQLAATAALGGIGFTVSLFIAQLALGDVQLQDATIGVFAGSMIAAALGVALLARSLPRSGERTSAAG